jgi:hypothetical protein
MRGPIKRPAAEKLRVARFPAFPLAFGFIAPAPDFDPIADYRPRRIAAAAPAPAPQAKKVARSRE